MEKQEERGSVPGYVYIVSSSCIWVDSKNQGVKVVPVKIGAAKDTDTRMGNLNSAVPEDFVMHMRIWTPDMYLLESSIHNELANERVGNSEFFTCLVKTAKETAVKVLKNVIKGKGWSSRDIRVEHKIIQFGRSAAKRKAIEDKLLRGDIRFECSSRKKNVAAIGFMQKLDNGDVVFIVEKGSKIAITGAPSFSDSEPHSYFVRWKDLIKRGVDEEGRLLRDEQFSSRAEAASVMLASIRNGNEEWVEITSDKRKGRSLGEFFGK